MAHLNFIKAFLDQLYIIHLNIINAFIELYLTSFYMSSCVNALTVNNKEKFSNAGIGTPKNVLKNLCKSWVQC